MSFRRTYMTWQAPDHQAQELSVENGSALEIHEKGSMKMHSTHMKYHQQLEMQKTLRWDEGKPVLQNNNSHQGEASQNNFLFGAFPSWMILKKIPLSNLKAQHNSEQKGPQYWSYIRKHGQEEDTITLHKTNISHLGKFGKSSTQKCLQKGDMLVPRRLILGVVSSRRTLNATLILPKPRKTCNP